MRRIRKKQHIRKDNKNSLEEKVENFAQKALG
jgi:hypothetical protein